VSEKQAGDQTGLDNPDSRALTIRVLKAGALQQRIQDGSMAFQRQFQVAARFHISSAPAPIWSNFSIGNIVDNGSQSRRRAKVPPGCAAALTNSP